MGKIICWAIVLTIFFNIVFPVIVFCTEQGNDEVVAKRIYILRYVLVKFIIKVMAIYQEILQEDVGIGLKVTAQEGLEECYMLLQLLEISVERK